MFDTNCFYQIANGEIEILNLDDNEYFVTPIQKRELQEKEVNKKFSKDRKERLLSTFNTIDKRDKNLETGLLGHSEAGQLPMKLGTTGWYEKFRKDLDKFKKETNNIDDALIAEVAITNEIILVTNDKKLIDVVEVVKPSLIMSFEEFKKEFLKNEVKNKIQTN